MTIAVWPDAAYGGQSRSGKCRLGYFIGLMSPNLRVPCHIIQWTLKFARKLVRSGLGGEVFAFSEMLGDMSMFRDFFGYVVGLFPGTAGLEDCESLFTYLKKKKVLAGKFSVRHFAALQQAILVQELGNVYWRRKKATPSSSLLPLLLPRLRPMESGTYNPGYLRLLKGLAFREH